MKYQIKRINKMTDATAVLEINALGKVITLLTMG